MGANNPRILRQSKQQAITVSKLRSVILSWLDTHETDLAADFRPESEQWRQILATVLANHIILSINKAGGLDESGNS